jgi:hypothetical protein
MATDGTQGQTSEPGAGGWDSVFAEGLKDSGVDPSLPFATDGTESETAPQGEAASSPVVPETPQAPPTGDDGAAGTAQAAQAPAATPPAPATPDDFAAAKPFQYTVDGETKTIDGTFMFDDEGLLVPKDLVPQFQQLASRADTLERQNRELADSHQSSQQRDATWQRLSSWDIQTPDGKTQTVTGERGLAEMRLAAQRGQAILGAIGPIFDDPTAAARLTMQVQGNDGQIYTIWNQDGIKSLQLQARIGAMEAERQAWGKIGQLQAPPPPTAPTAQEIAARAPATVDEIATAQKLTGLTAADKTFLASLVPRYVRSDGLVDPSFIEVMKDRAAIRAESIQAAQKAATTAATAQKFNNGMTNGQKAKTPARPAQPTPTPQPTARPSKASMWDKVFEDALPDHQNLRTMDDALNTLNQ